MASCNFAFSSSTFDPSSGVLKRNGKLLRIPPQEALLLTILLERAGTVVTREEIQRLLWPDGEMIDHDHAINRAINHLRMVLRDSSQKSKFIETYPKRGYAFKESVTRLPVENVSASLVAAESLPAPVAALAVLQLETIEPSDGPRFVEEAPDLTVEATLAVEAEAAPSTVLATQPFAHRGAGVRWTTRASGFLRKPWVFVPAVSVLLIVVAAVLFSGREEAHSSVVSLGIAPIESQGVGADKLGESFRLELLDALSELPMVQVRGSHSLNALPPDDAKIREVSANLNLDVLLLGRLTMLNNNCVFQFELVRGKDAVHLASFQYSGSTDELATIRDKVQREVYSKLQSTGRPVQAVRGSTQNPQAYEYYLRGRELSYQRTKDSLTGALQQYGFAIDRDPEFARAYAGLATAHMAIYDYRHFEEDRVQAKASAEKAIALDPGLAEAHAVLGNIAFNIDWKFSQGENELRHALELDPHQATYHAWLAEMLAIQGRFEESLHEIDLAHSDDPLWPQLYNMEIPISAAAREFGRALNAAEKYEALMPDSPHVRDQLAWTLFGENRFQDAIAEWKRMAAMENDPARGALEDRGLAALKQGGVTAYAKIKLDASLHTPAMANKYPNDFIASEWYAYLHDVDHAVAVLDKQVAAHDSQVLDIVVDPMFDNLHRDPRFQAIVLRVGLKLPANYPGDSLRAAIN
jgi:DNA-binding winged helix-turn-helix (wHTH) protein/tetratricopeptide (TPR) repeat protein